MKVNMEKECFRMRMLCIWFLFCFVFVCSAIDHGGVSVDFRKNIGNAVSGTGENWISGGSFEKEADFQTWQPSHWVHLAAGDGDFNAFHQQVRPLMRREWKNGAVRFFTDPEIKDIKNAKGGLLMVSNRLSRTVSVPGAGKYLFSFRLSGKFFPWKGFNGFRVALRGMDRAGGHPLGREYAQIYPLSEQGTEQKLEFLVPEGTTAVSIQFAMYGIGEATLDDISLSKGKVSTGLTAKLVPFAMLDNTFCVPEKMAIPVLFGLRNESGKKSGSPHFFLRLPEGFRILASRPDNPMSRLENNTWKVDISRLQATVPAAHFSVSGAVVDLQIENALTASEKSYPAQYWTEDGTWKSPVETFELKILRLEKSPRPKRFQSGFFFMNDVVYNEQGARSFVEFLNTTGFNCADYVPRDIGLEMRKNGYGIYGESVANGYRIGPNPKPPEALFLLADGTPYRTPGNTENICPTEVYTQGRYYREKVIPFFDRHLEMLDNFMGNWEPFMFDNKGCFCERCRKEFTRYAKADPDEIRAVWGTKLPGSKWYDTWVKFRSWQHARLVQTLDETLAELGKKRGKESHFIPMISYTCLLTPSQHRQYDILDYMDKLKVIEPWGPYVYHRFSEPYQYFCGWNLITWLAAKKMAEFSEKNIPDPAKRPKLIALPHGYQGNDWVTEPELIALETLGFFLNRFEGTFIYFFPGGYDYRYWRAMTETNRLIAECEHIVMDGEDVTTQIQLIPESGLPLPNLPMATVSWNDYSAIPEARTASLLQYCAYRKDHRLLVAAGNFWKYGDVFFTLRVKKLERRTQYAVSDLRENLFYGVFSGKELDKGILAHAGAVRWAFLEIEPVPAGKMYGDAFSQSQMRSAMEKRLPVLKKRLEEEAALTGARFHVKNDYKKVPSLQAFGIKAGPFRLGGNDFIRVDAPGYSLFLDAENGGRILQWKRKDTVLSGETDKMGIGLDSFMKPVCRIFNGPWQIAGGGVDLEGLKYTLFQNIPETNEPIYGGLSLTKNIIFLPEALKIEVIVENQGKSSRSFVYRSHNMTAFLTTRGNQSGEVVCGNVVLRRNHAVTLIEVGHSTPAVKEIYSKAVPLSGGTPELIFSAPWTKTILTGHFSPDGLEFFAFWDSDAIHSFSSAEALYRARALKPGEKTTFSAVWTFK